MSSKNDLTYQDKVVVEIHFFISPTGAIQITPFLAVSDFPLPLSYTCLQPLPPTKAYIIIRAVHISTLFEKLCSQCLIL